MKHIGVTGGIGSGKSVVCRVFAALGAPVYSADDRARWLTNHDSDLRAEIISLLGTNAYDATGQYDRTWVAGQVFGNPDALARLNALIHPRVFADTVAWATAHRTAPYLVREAALIDPSRLGNTLDVIVVVTAPVGLRLARIRQRDPQRSEADIRQIMARQLTDDDRARFADHVLLNDESALLLPQILALDARFRAND
jgi:dephospho-CoA kinase